MLEPAERIVGSPEPDRPESPFRLVAALLVLFVLLLFATFRPGREPSELNPGAVRSSVDPNSAPWWELTILPGIGEVRAREIVSFRESEISRRGLESKVAVFRVPTDLEAVRGIGPGIVRQISAELHFGNSAPSTDAGRDVRPN